MKLCQEERVVLLKAARDSIKSTFDGREVPQPDFDKFPTLKILSGAFVTLTIDNNLRGCIGFISAGMNLFDTICEAAIQAGFRDPRFLPVSRDEVDRLKIEISVLSRSVTISSYDEIEIGKHGLILNHLGRRGLLLPQVAPENNFTRDKFLCAICEKAGFEPYLWQKQKLKIDVFTAEIFSDEGERKKSYVSS